MSRWNVNLGAVAVATLLLAPSVVANDGQAENAPTVAPAAVVTEAVVPGTTRVLKIVPRAAVVANAPTNAMMVAWDADKRAVTAPTSESLAALSADFDRRMAELAGGARLAQPGQVEQITLANGAIKARLPADLLSASLVRVDGAGHFYPMCVDGPVEAAAALDTPTVAGPAQQ